MTLTTITLPSCDHQMDAVNISGQDYYFAPETQMWYSIDSADSLIAAISDEDAEAYSRWCGDNECVEIWEDEYGGIWRALNDYRAAWGGRPRGGAA